MKIAKIEITDIKEKGGVYIVGAKISAGRYKFSKAFSLRPIVGEVSVDAFKKQLKEVIIKEIEHRKAVEPIKLLAKTPFEIEYGDDKS